MVKILRNFFICFPFKRVKDHFFSQKGNTPTSVSIDLYSHFIALFHSIIHKSTTHGSHKIDTPINYLKICKMKRSHQHVILLSSCQGYRLNKSSATVFTLLYPVSMACDCSTDQRLYNTQIQWAAQGIPCNK